MTSALQSLRDARAARTAGLLLEMDVSAGLLEETPTDPLARLQARRKPTMTQVLTALREGADDPKVHGLIARVGGAALTLTQVQELREAVLDFRSRGAGKPVVAWAESFGEFGPGGAGYLLAAAFEEIWLQPSGDVGLTGAAVEAVFLRTALDRIGIEPQAGQRYEYKNAPDTFLRTGFSEPHREASARVVGSGFDQLVAGIADGRRLAPEAVRAAVDRGPLVAAEALAAGLVDRLGYRDEAYAAVRSRVPAAARLTYVSRYSRHRSPLATTRRRLSSRSSGHVALISGTGGIRSGRSGRSPLGGASIGADTVCAALRAASADDKVKAVVFRVNSPGGSYVASDAIWREVGQVRAGGKPVVVSMGAYAASGGYFVSCGADAIVALPGTLTGSIGVFGGKPVLSGLLERLGIGTDAVTEGAHARMFSPRTRFTDEEWDRLSVWLDRVYGDFVAKVAAGRSLTPERVHEIARGRVWTGADAAGLGLVDELGGLATAARIARERAGLPADAALQRFPQVPLARRMVPARSSEDPAAAAAAGLDLPPALSGLAGRLGLGGGALVMPPVQLRV